MLAMENRLDNAPLADRVLTALRQSAFAAVRRLECEAKDGVVRLRGQVPTFYTRQVALGLARRVRGVECVIDQIEVRSSKKT
jgi:osmotically-inducible protein OsmY